jgi:choice-of-anchor C domain-containing protein
VLLLCPALLALGACDDETPVSPTPSVSVVQLAVAQSAFLLNGSFEEGPAVETYDVRIKAGSKDLVAWTVSGGGIDYLGHPWDVADGARAVDLDGDGPGAISQTFGTTQNQTYIVWFDLAGNPGGGPAVKHVRVTVDGYTADYSYNTSGQSNYSLVWQPISFSFVATGTSATLSFTSLSDAGSTYGALIDKVSVVRP